MKTIHIYALHLGVGGVEKYVASLANMLSDAYQVTIISTYKVLESPGFTINDNVKVTYLLQTYPKAKEFKAAVKSFNIFKAAYYAVHSVWLLLMRSWKNYQAIKHDDADVIFTTRTLHNKLVSKYAHEGIIKIATEHNHPFSSDYETQLLQSIQAFDYFLPISNYLTEYYAEKLKDTSVKCVHIPFYVEQQEYPSFEGKTETIAFVGRLEEEKQPLDAIKVFERLHKDYPTYTMDVYGEGSMKEQLIDYVSVNNLSEVVTFHGFVDQDTLREAYKKMSYLLITSTRESFGFAALEAMSHGVVPLTYRYAHGVSEILESVPDLIDSNNSVESMKELLVKCVLSNDNFGPIVYTISKEYNYQNTHDQMMAFLMSIEE